MVLNNIKPRQGQPPDANPEPYSPVARQQTVEPPAASTEGQPPRDNVDAMAGSPTPAPGRTPALNEFASPITPPADNTDRVRLLDPAYSAEPTSPATPSTNPTIAGERNCSTDPSARPDVAGTADPGNNTNRAYADAVIPATGDALALAADVLPPVENMLAPTSDLLPPTNDILSPAAADPPPATIAPSAATNAPDPVVFAPPPTADAMAPAADAAPPVATAAAPVADFINNMGALDAGDQTDHDDEDIVARFVALGLLNPDEPAEPTVAPARNLLPAPQGVTPDAQARQNTMLLYAACYHPRTDWHRILLGHQTRFAHLALEDRIKNTAKLLTDAALSNRRMLKVSGRILAMTDEEAYVDTSIAIVREALELCLRPLNGAFPVFT